MAAIQASIPLFSSASSSSHNTRGGLISATINLPRRMTNSSRPSLQTRGLVNELNLQKFIEQQLSPNSINTLKTKENNSPDPLVMAKLYAILEAVSDRVEMHKNIGEQRSNWNSLLLTSINALTLTAATMAGIAATSTGGPVAALKVSSTVLYLSATGMLSIMNNIQPSQLAEEQRNATRLFKQLQNQIETLISIGNPTTSDVKEMMEKVLALDRAYPLPLLGAMLEKFPDKVEPAKWWSDQRRRKSNGKKDWNGWNGKLEEEMIEIDSVIKRKDKEDYLRLGSKALKLNKFLAITGPVLTGLAAIGSAFIGSPDHYGSLAAMLGIVGGALASVVNSFEHGGQVGMVFEMYRSNAGFFELLEETIESNLMEKDLGRRENGELFEMKMALQLGRSLSELRDLADSSSSRGDEIDEFAGKLF